MNNFLRNNIYELCNKIKDIDYIEGMFATSLDLENVVILNLLVNSNSQNYKLKNTIHNQEKDGVTYEIGIYYHPKDECYAMDYDNLTDRQIHFLEMLNLSEIYIDKTGILYQVKQKINNISKNNQTKK